MLYRKRHPTKGRRGGGVPSSFYENGNEHPDLGKKCADCVHLWNKFFIQIVVLRLSMTRNSRLFHCVALFLCAFDKISIDEP